MDHLQVIWSLRILGVVSFGCSWRWMEGQLVLRALRNLLSWGSASKLTLEDVCIAPGDRCGTGGIHGCRGLVVLLLEQFVLSSAGFTMLVQEIRLCAPDYGSALNGLVFASDGGMSGDLLFLWR